ncbi:hypothetical protein LCGC14_2885230, partial [marine sediment metagenome]
MPQPAHAEDAPPVGDQPVSAVRDKSGRQADALGPIDQRLDVGGKSALGLPGQLLVSVLVALGVLGGHRPEIVFQVRRRVDQREVLVGHGQPALSAQQELIDGRHQLLDVLDRAVECGTLLGRQVQLAVLLYPAGAEAAEHCRTHGYNSKAFARATGLFGHVDADAFNTTILASQVLGEQNALVTAGPRDISVTGAWDAQNPLQADIGSLDHLAFYVDTTNGATSANHTSTASKRSLATGGSNSNGSGLSVTTGINFSSDVVILSGRNPRLVIDGSGNIAEAVNVTVNSGQTSGLVIGDIS